MRIPSSSGFSNALLGRLQESQGDLESGLVAQIDSMIFEIALGLWRSLSALCRHRLS
jgi:hypothetical protein